MISKNKEEIILDYVDYSDYKKGRNYYRPFVMKKTPKLENNKKISKFEVESEHTSNIYLVNFETDINLGKITSISCTCPQFHAFDSCKHVAACLYNYFDEIIPVIKSRKYLEKISENFLDVFDNSFKNQNKQIKQEVKIEVYLYGENEFGNIFDTLDIELKVGTDKLYSCKNRKISNFLDAIQNNNEYYFGKYFTYDPNTCYISEENMKIINYLLLINEPKDYYDYYQFFKGRQSIKKIIELMSNKTLYLNGYKIYEIKNSFPYKTRLIKDNEDFKLQIKYEPNTHLITSDLEYVQVKNILYILNEKEKLFLKGLYVNEIDELIIKKENKSRFSKSILTTIYKNIEIDKDIDDFQISKEVNAKLYFNILNNKLVCDIAFKYDNDEINYFDNNSSILRNNEFEEQVINELIKFKFEINNNSFELVDIDNIGSFIENDLIKFTDKYDVYTSENLKKINVIKKPSVKSSFSIGKDNILSYNFNIENINNDEIGNILSALKKKKKYYRLKSGDIVNIESNSELDELNNLIEDLSITEDDLSNHNFELPKYRAIYLDSLRNNKYHIIDTNNLFDELINKFKMYKNSNVSLSNKENKLLRPYQIDGIRWLYNIDKTGFGGILADEMGLGKSIQTIYYIKEMLKENKDYVFLIVSPTSLIYNWENEFNKFEPKIKKTILAGNRTKRREILENNNGNVLITTYGLIREDKAYYEKMNFKTIIIDEAQNIKNYNSEIAKSIKKIKAETKFALTGTPIENSISEIWSIFDFIMPGMLPDIDIFDKKFIIKEFDEKANNKLNELNKIINPFILRRRKRDVIKDLPEKIENNIYVELTETQKKLYLAELDNVNKQMEEIIKTGGVSQLRFMVLQLLTKLRQICINPNIIYKDYKGGSGKMDEFLKVVDTMVKNSHKILIFTSFKEALKLAKEQLDSKKITSYVIDGSVSSKKRMELVDKFNNDDTNVFFIMLKAGGTGLNLTSADVVIHLDLWWNPQAENQATDRTHRIGQTKNVEVIKFISRGTIEEKILELQNKKKILSDKLIDQNNSEIVFNKLTEEDIRMLISYNNELE